MHSDLDSFKICPNGHAHMDMLAVSKYLISISLPQDKQVDDPSNGMESGYVPTSQCLQVTNELCE